MFNTLGDPAMKHTRLSKARIQPSLGLLAGLAICLSPVAPSAASTGNSQPDKPTSPPAPTQPVPTPTPSAKPESKPETKPPADPSVDDLIKDVTKPSTPAAPSTTPTTPAPGHPVKPADTAPASTPAPATPAARPAGSPRAAQPAPSRLVREGTFIVSRKGRLVSAGGEWTFVFDAGPQQRAGNDPAMRVIPCEKLMAMERVAEKHGDSVSFNLTGQVFVYHGKNYILPTNYVINRPADDVKPLQ